MATLYTRGDVKPVCFRLIDSNGNKVTGHTFLSDDMYWKGWDGTTWSAWTADGLNVTNQGRGFYDWTPSQASKSQYEIVLLDIDDSVGTAFIDNGKIVHTGGDSSAFHDG